MMSEGNTVVKIKRALVSVSDKSGLDTLARALNDNGVEIIASGGTRKFIEECQVPCTPIEQVTKNPEAFGGRMKTLSFQVSSALLYRRDNEDDLKQAEELDIDPIDLVVCNLYPFEATANSGADWEDVIENIDIGGPTMIRAAAKNHAAVCVCTTPAQYDDIAQQVQASGGVDMQTRQRMALEAFRHTARYDSAIANRMENHLDIEPKTPVIGVANAPELRYGENPHQRAWVVADPFDSGGIASTEPLQGKALSYNNLLDADAAWRSNGDIAALFGEKHVVTIIKHLGPCGAAVAKDAQTALETAWAGDPVSSFGGIVCFNREVTKQSADWLNERFVEVVIAPSFARDALEAFATKKNLRLLAVPPHDGENLPQMLRAISGGWVVQDEDTGVDDTFEQATTAVFEDDKLELAKFGVMASKHLKSNAIGLFKQDGDVMSMIGAGMGNPNRVVSMRQAIEKAAENGHDDLSDAVLISDAFFPFPDNIEIAAGAGIRFIVQPGGSIKDKDVIAACEDAGIAMVFTGRRHFRH